MHDDSSGIAGSSELSSRPWTKRQRPGRLSMRCTLSAAMVATHLSSDNLMTLDRPNGVRYCYVMIEGFRCDESAKLLRRQHFKQFAGIARAAARRQMVLDAARLLDDLRVPPVNRQEKSSGDRRGQHSIRTNDQWRICLRWREGHASDVVIVDCRWVTPCQGSPIPFTPARFFWRRSVGRWGSVSTFSRRISAYPQEASLRSCLASGRSRPARLFFSSDLQNDKAVLDESPDSLRPRARERPSRPPSRPRGSADTCRGIVRRAMPNETLDPTAAFAPRRSA